MNLLLFLISGKNERETMKEKNIYQLFGCRNKNELYRKVKNGSPDVKGLTDFINFLKKDRIDEKPLINSNIKLMDYCKDNKLPDGKYMLFLDSQYNLLRVQQAGKMELNKMIRGGIESGARNIIIIEVKSDQDYFKTSLLEPSASEKAELKKMKDKLEPLELNLAENFTYAPLNSNYHSFIESGIFEEEKKFSSSGQINENMTLYNVPADTKEYEAREYSDPVIQNFQGIERTDEFLRHYAEKELKNLSMTEHFGKVKENLKTELSELNREIFSVMFIDKKNKIIKKENLFEGTLTRSTVYLRELVKRILEEKNKFSGIVAVHNHPGGSLKPSESDIVLTAKIKEVLETIGTELKDHLIVSRTGIFSFVQEDMLDNRYSQNLKNVKEQPQLKMFEKNMTAKYIDNFLKI